MVYILHSVSHLEGVAQLPGHSTWRCQQGSSGCRLPEASLSRCVGFKVVSQHPPSLGLLGPSGFGCLCVVLVGCLPTHVFLGLLSEWTLLGIVWVGLCSD